MAEELGEFVLFLSFDMAAGEWSLEQVVCLINQFKVTSAQCRVDGLPFVSTFEGPGWAENWSRVREGTGGIFLVPDWSSLGPHGVGEKLGLIDGAFSWCAWPRAGQRRLNTEEDIAYRRVLDDKAYMMGISPWFYTSMLILYEYELMDMLLTLFFFFPFRLCVRTSTVGQELVFIRREVVV